MTNFYRGGPSSKEMNPPSAGYRKPEWGSQRPLHDEFAHRSDLLRESHSKKRESPVRIVIPQHSYFENSVTTQEMPIYSVPSANFELIKQSSPEPSQMQVGYTYEEPNLRPVFERATSFIHQLPAAFRSTAEKIIHAPGAIADFIKNEFTVDAPFVAGKVRSFLLSVRDRDSVDARAARALVEERKQKRNSTMGIVDIIDYAIHNPRALLRFGLTLSPVVLLTFCANLPPGVQAQTNETPMPITAPVPPEPTAQPTATKSAEKTVSIDVGNTKGIDNIERFHKAVGLISAKYKDVNNVSAYGVSESGSVFIVNGYIPVMVTDKNDAILLSDLDSVFNRFPDIDPKLVQEIKEGMRPPAGNVRLEAITRPDGSDVIVWAQYFATHTEDGIRQGQIRIAKVAIDSRTGKLLPVNIFNSFLLGKNLVVSLDTQSTGNPTTTVDSVLIGNAIYMFTADNIILPDDSILAFSMPQGLTDADLAANPDLIKKIIAGERAVRSNLLSQGNADVQLAAFWNGATNGDSHFNYLVSNADGTFNLFTFASDGLTCSKRFTLPSGVTLSGLTVKNGIVYDAGLKQLYPDLAEQRLEQQRLTVADYFKKTKNMNIANVDINGKTTVATASDGSVWLVTVDGTVTAANVVDLPKGYTAAKAFADPNKPALVMVASDGKNSAFYDSSKSAWLNASGEQIWPEVNTPFTVEKDGLKIKISPLLPNDSKATFENIYGIAPSVASLTNMNLRTYDRTDQLTSILAGNQPSGFRDFLGSSAKVTSVDFTPDGKALALMVTRVERVGDKLVEKNGKIFVSGALRTLIPDRNNKARYFESAADITTLSLDNLKKLLLKQEVIFQDSTTSPGTFNIESWKARIPPVSNTTQGLWSSATTGIQ